MPIWTWQLLGPSVGEQKKIYILYIPQSCQVISYNCAMASVSWPTAMELLREMVINAYQPTAACMHQGEVLGGF